jgi:hypothetical protein
VCCCALLDLNFQLVHSARDALPAAAVDLALRLTLLDLLLRPVGNWALRPTIIALAIAGLLNARWLRQPLLWLVLTGLLAARVLLDWPLADNHAYLLAYWCLAIALACMLSEQQGVLALNARLMIGLVFAFACAWKFFGSMDYLDGTFFKVTLILDDRFEGFVQVIAGIDRDTLEALLQHLETHRDTPMSPAPSVPVLPLSLANVALAATAWNLFINAALAFAFLWPGDRLSNARHLLLLVYCVVTYAIATVDGFGWLLLAMGSALCGADQRRLRAVYVVVFVLIIFYREVPWAELILDGRELLLRR